MHLKVNLFDFPTVSPAAVLQQQQATASSRVCFLNILHQQLGAAVGLFKEFQVVPFFLTEKIWWLFLFQIFVQTSLGSRGRWAFTLEPLHATTEQSI